MTDQLTDDQFTDAFGLPMKDGHEFLNKVASIMKDTDSEEMLKEVFSVLDSDQNGVIDAIELHNVMKNIGENITDKEIDEMMREVDVDSDGQINFEVFVKLFMAK